MDILLKAVKIIYPGSAWNLKTADLLIEKGRIKKIDKKLKAPKGVEVLEGKGLHVSPGWVDMNAYLADPGFEHKEDINTGIKAAAAGGFTATCCMPNTHPAIHSKSEVEYVINKAKGKVVDVYPVGAISRDCEGKDITEMYDMHYAGAIAYSDGLGKAISSGLTLRALQYVKPFEGLVITNPNDTSLSHGGQMHEGAMSTSLGMMGIPVIAEELTIQRDLQLLDYSESRLHLAYISAKGSVDLVKKAKAAGKQVTCSVSPYNLCLTDEALAGYDTNLKVSPPIRAKEDVTALVKALNDGVIDTIASFHVPHDTEAKELEFDLADFGMIGFETTFALLNTHLKGKVGVEILVNALAVNPRKILGLPLPELKEGERANLTIFNTETEWTFNKSHIRSRSKNTPFVGTAFTGRVLGVINNGQTVLNA